MKRLIYLYSIVLTLISVSLVQAQSSTSGWLGYDDIDFLGGANSTTLEEIRQKLNLYNSKAQRIRLYIYLGSYEPYLRSQEKDFKTIAEFNQHIAEESKKSNPISIYTRIKNRISDEFWKEGYGLLVGLQGFVDADANLDDERTDESKTLMVGRHYYGVTPKLDDRVKPFYKEIKKIIAKHKRPIILAYKDQTSRIGTGEERAKRLLTMINELILELDKHNPYALTKKEAISDLVFKNNLSYNGNNRVFKGTIKDSNSDLSKRQEGEAEAYKDPNHKNILIADYVGLKKGLSFGTGDKKAQKFLSLAKTIKVTITNEATKDEIKSYLSQGIGLRRTDIDKYKNFGEFAYLKPDEMMLWIHFNSEGEKEVRFWFSSEIEHEGLKQLRQEFDDFIMRFYDGRALIETMEAVSEATDFLSKNIRNLKSSEEFRKLEWIQCEKWSCETCCSKLKEEMSQVVAMYDGILEEGAGMVETVGAVSDAIAFATHFARDDDNIRTELLEIASELTFDDVEDILYDVAEDVISDIWEYYEEVQKAIDAGDNVKLAYYRGQIITTIASYINPFSKGKKIKAFIKEFKDVFKRRKNRKNKKDKDEKGSPKLTGKGLIIKHVSYTSGKRKQEVVGEGKVKTIAGEKLLEITLLKPKSQGVATKGKIIKKLLRNTIAEKGLYVNKSEASAKNSEVGKWAISKGYKVAKAGSGTKFTKEHYYVEKPKSGSKVWKVLRSKGGELLASGVYNDDLKTLRIDLDLKRVTQEKEEVLDALWEELTTGNNPKRINVIYTILDTDKRKFDGLSQDATQSTLNEKGLETSIGQWAMKIKSFRYTLLSYYKNTSNIKQVRFAKTTCFVAGTKVWLSDYTTKNIEEIKQGELVWAFDPILKKETIGKVTYTMVKKASVLIKVYTQIDTLLVTPEHPFYVNGQWIEAGRLKKGYELTLLNREKLLATNTRYHLSSKNVFIDSIATQDTLVKVYNFTVARYHNYYVGNAGILVHNNACGDVEVIVSNETHNHLKRKNLPIDVWTPLGKVGENNQRIKIKETKLYLLLHWTEGQGKGFNKELLKVKNIQYVFSRPKFITAIRNELTVNEIKDFFKDMLKSRRKNNNIVLKDLVTELRDYGNQFLKPALVTNWKRLYKNNKIILRKDLNALLDPEKALKKNNLQTNLDQIKNNARECVKCLEYYRKSATIRDNIINKSESRNLYKGKKLTKVDWITFFGDYEAHHILPKDLIVNNAAMQFYLTYYKGNNLLKFNDLENGIMLKKYSSSLGEGKGVHASHENYTSAIRKYLQDTFDNLGEMTDEDKANSLHNKILSLVSGLKTVIKDLCINGGEKVNALPNFQQFNDLLK